MGYEQTTEEWKEHQKKAEEKSKLSWEKLNQQILPFVVGLSGLGFIFTGIGFVISKASLSLYTDVSFYSINPIQYIGASAYWIYFVLILVYFPFMVRRAFRTTKRFKQGLPFVVGGSLASLFQTFVVVIMFSVLIKEKDIASYLFLTSLGIIIYVLSLYTFFSISEEIRQIGSKIFAVSVVVSMIVAFLFPFIDIGMGGGKPAGVQIVFSDAETLELIGLPISPDNENMSQTICLLAELNDGLLIYVPSQVRDEQYTVTVPNELIVSLIDTGEAIDCRAPFFVNQSLPTATPQPTATP